MCLILCRTAHFSSMNASRVIILQLVRWSVDRKINMDRESGEAEKQIRIHHTAVST